MIGSNKLWPTAALAVLMLFGSVAAWSQQGGAMLNETVTFAGTDTATIEISVAGPRAANTATVVSLEFGQDGKAGPTAGPTIPDNVSFTVSSGGNSKVFHPVGNDAVQAFPSKQVDFSRPDSTNPNRFSLSVIHLGGVHAGATEIWRLVIAGLSGANWRAIGMVTQGNFTRLTPSGLAYGTHSIDIAPAQVKTGQTVELTATSLTGFDFSAVVPAQVSITPDDDIGAIQVTQAKARSLVLSVGLLNGTQPGTRSVSIRANDTSVHGSFAVVQGPAIRISPVAWNAAGTASVVVTALGGVDLSNVRPENVIVTSSLSFVDGSTYRATAITNQTPTSITAALPITQATPSDFFNPGFRLTVVTAGGSFTGRFVRDPSREQRTCKKGYHCCDFFCNICLSQDQLCQ
jgi:hypothetical protein